MVFEIVLKNNLGVEAGERGQGSGWNKLGHKVIAAEYGNEYVEFIILYFLFMHVFESFSNKNFNKKNFPVRNPPIWGD